MPPLDDFSMPPASRDAKTSAYAWPKPAGGWPPWVFQASYVAAAHPQQRPRRPIVEGANCQRYAYGVLALFGIAVPDHRSSELWRDPAFKHPVRESARDLDLALFNTGLSAWGAHVAVVLGGRLLHLSVEVGSPTIWDWQDFAARDRALIGLVRCSQLPPTEG